ncbi:hypothetical protein Micbo1qcDRAFT_212423, partial [Microdochium bolleyi]
LPRVPVPRISILLIANYTTVTILSLDLSFTTPAMAIDCLSGLPALAASPPQPPNRKVPQLQLRHLLLAELRTRKALLSARLVLYATDPCDAAAEVALPTGIAAPLFRRGLGEPLAACRAHVEDADVAAHGCCICG